MDYDRLFRFLIIDKEVGKETVTGGLLDSIGAAIKARGFNVHTAKTAFEAKIAIQNDAAIACFLIDWDQDSDDFSTTEGTLATVGYVAFLLVGCMIFTAVPIILFNTSKN